MEESGAGVPEGAVNAEAGGRPADEHLPEHPAPGAARFPLPAPEFDLARLAATLRGVIPRVDEEARERLEAAWVSLTNAMKQPKADAARLSRRVRRLREELDQWVGRESRSDDTLEERGDTPGRESL
jgi:hypothetical protein